MTMSHDGFFKEIKQATRKNKGMRNNYVLRKIHY